MAKRKAILEGITPVFHSPCGNVYVTINRDENGVSEIFCNGAKSGSCGRVILEALARMVSLAVRSGVKKSDITKTLKGLRCKEADDERPSCAECIALALEVDNHGTGKG